MALCLLLLFLSWIFCEALRSEWINARHNELGDRLNEFGVFDVFFLYPCLFRFTLFFFFYSLQIFIVWTKPYNMTDLVLWYAYKKLKTMFSCFSWHNSDHLSKEKCVKQLQIWHRILLSVSFIWNPFSSTETM